MKRGVLSRRLVWAGILILAGSSFVSGLGAVLREARAQILRRQLQSSSPIILFSDNFDRPDSSLVGNDWIEVETTGALAEILGNRVCFPDTSDATNRPMISHTFTQVSEGQLIWEFDFDWKRVRAEKRYSLFLQLGEAAKMSDQAQGDGVGVNLVWTTIGNMHELLAYHQQSVLSGLQVVSGPARLRIEVDLNSHHYNVFVNEVGVGNQIAFDSV